MSNTETDKWIAELNAAHERGQLLVRAKSMREDSGKKETEVTFAIGGRGAGELWAVIYPDTLTREAEARNQERGPGLPPVKSNGTKKK